jgi:hypothetical protein
MQTWANMDKCVDECERILYNGEEMRGQTKGETLDGYTFGNVDTDG